MKTKHAQDLPKLPAEVATLVEDGVYALYDIDHADAAYLLVTNAGEVYCLDDVGDLLHVPSIREVSDATILGAVTLEREASSVRINQG